MPQQSELDRLRKAMADKALEIASRKSAPGGQPESYNPKGCCVITITSGSSAWDNYTREDCIDVQEDFPGSDYKFYDNRRCSDV